VSTRSLGQCAVAVLVAASLLVVPAAASGAMPKGVQAWLGTWHANFGTLRVDDIHRERAKYPNADGKRPYFWAASINWSRPDFNERITGVILGGKYDYRTFSGCWQPPDPAVSCGNVLIGRTGHKLSGGYWKACRTYCKSHHPWKGKKTSGAWRIGFQFTQHGRPLDGPPGPTQIGGAGAAISLVDPDRGKPWQATGDSRIFLVAEGPRGQERRLTIKPSRTDYHLVGDDTPRLMMRGRVTASNDERCSTGERVEVTIVDGKQRAADKIRLDPDDGSCDRRARWSSLGNGDVDVRIDFPRQTSG
jgi:hypothetical protein